MLDVYLDLSDKTEMVNFLSRWIAFSSGKISSHADSYITDYDDGKDIDTVELANFVAEFAKSVFPARYALAKFFSEDGVHEEWSMVQKAVSNSTGHLMQRFKSSEDVHSINDLLEHEDFDLSFTDADRMEIENVRHHVWEDYWKRNKNTLQPLVDEGESELKKFEAMMGKLRDCAGGLPALLQEELYSKVTRFEDRMLYQAEVLDEQILDEELEYYLNQKEVPIE